MKGAIETVAIMLATYGVLEGIKYALSPVYAFSTAAIGLAVCVWLFTRSDEPKRKAPE